MRPRRTASRNAQGRLTGAELRKPRQRARRTFGREARAATHAEEREAVRPARNYGGAPTSAPRARRSR